jgi:hypothetical protein
MYVRNATILVGYYACKNKAIFTPAESAAARSTDGAFSSSTRVGSDAAPAPLEARKCTAPQNAGDVGPTAAGAAS